jgi:hypothetical protein
VEQRTQNWLQICGLISVIASLMFVGFELKQSRDIAVAQMYQDRAALDIQIRTHFAPSERIYDALQKSSAGQELTAQEQMALNQAIGNILIYWETNHLLYEMGMLDEEHWEASLRSIEHNFEEAYFNAAWEDERNSFRKSFQIVVDERVRSN